MIKADYKIKKIKIKIRKMCCCYNSEEKDSGNIGNDCRVAIKLTHKL